ncbi:MAG: carbon-nitrogen hydrolase family protein, partial [Chthoniobacteraceae bacterium]
MNSPRFFFRLLAFIAFSTFSQITHAGEAHLPDGWAAESPRDEIRPQFSFEPTGGSKGAGRFVITHDRREGLDGWIQKSFAVSGGEFYRVSTLRKTHDVAIPRHSALVRVLWRDDAGRAVRADATVGSEAGGRPLFSAEPEHPSDGATDAQGWTTVAGVYRAPAKATHAIMELHLQHAPNGRVEWSDVIFEKTAQPAARKVRLATVHFLPNGKSPRENCE